MLAGGRLRATWDAGEPAFGLWAGIPSSFTAELAAAAGYDYVCVDLQHGLSDEPTMVSMLQATVAAGSTALVRVAWNEPWLIMRALDLGAAGVIVPLVGSGADAARARAPQGFKLITVGVDSSLFKSAISSELADARTSTV